jgi:hypothetical protein
VQPHPALENARLAVLADYLERRAAREYDASDEAEQARRGIRAWQLAPTIAIYQALMRGESVPVSALDQRAVRRYGFRGRE